MGNARRLRRQLVDEFGPLDGARIPGGCDHCNAYQTITPISEGIWSATVHHDDWCPWLAAHEARHAS